MAAKKKGGVAPYTDLARPDDTGQEKFEEGAAKAALSPDAALSTYKDTDVPGQSVQELGKVK